MSRRRPFIPQKTPGLIFGEGKSEQGYARWLNQLANDTKLPFHFRGEALNGSDPLELVQQAISKSSRIAKNRKYRYIALILDTDLVGQNDQRDRMAKKAAAEKGLHLIWQPPCHEAFILKHFPGFEQHLLANCKDAERALLRVWPTYKKPEDAKGYGKVLTLDHLARARAANDDLNEFLNIIGWN